MTTTDVSPRREPTSGPADGAGPRRPTWALAWWTAALIALGAVVLGLLPWLVSGMRLPLQNLWARDTMPGDMPHALLPISQYAISTLLALIVVAWTIAGIAARATKAHWRRGAFWSMIAGAAGLQLVALVQSIGTVGAGLSDSVASALYLVLLTIVVVFAMLLGVVVFALLSRAPRAGALIGLALAAPLAGSWVALFFDPQNVGVGGIGGGVAFVERWLPAVFVAAAIVWCGVGSVGRVVASIVGLILLWISPAVLTGVAAAAGMRVLASTPGEMASFGLGVTRLVAGTLGQSLPPLILAVVIAAVGLGVRFVVARLRAGAATG
jgi:hypothetical protein